MTQQEGDADERIAAWRWIPTAGFGVWFSATALAARIRDRQLRVREVMNAFLDRIDAISPHLNAIVSLRPRSGLLREAEAPDDIPAAGTEWARNMAIIGPRTPRDPLRPGAGDGRHVKCCVPRMEAWSCVAHPYTTPSWRTLLSQM